MRIKYLEQVSSTNTYMLEQEDLLDYDVVYTKNQTSGRGRRGNKWYSSEGSALFSVNVKEIEKDTFLPYIVGISIYNILIKKIEVNQNKLMFKWPNDLYYENKKISGILIEKTNQNNVIGIGINLNNKEFGVYKDTATSIYEITGKENDIKEIIIDVVKELKININNINNDEKIEELINKINDIHILNGKYIEIEDGKKIKVEKIEVDGSIKLTDNETEKTFKSLDIKRIFF